MSDCKSCLAVSTRSKRDIVVSVLDSYSPYKPPLRKMSKASRARHVVILRAIADPAHPVSTCSKRKIILFLVLESYPPYQPPLRKTSKASQAKAYAVAEP